MLFCSALTFTTYLVVSIAGTLVAGLTQQETNGRIEVASTWSQSADEGINRQFSARNLFGTKAARIPEKQC